ncbi:Hypothetical predicted protein [Cloeon dipterum]|uniref:Uncharacterized protein n=1 Tax=Cloeon dipterum TaxID=197152 RepID=A0A8S1CZR1_9INSE|nr:Hypothetical predicted protein [Cloeon dipterum]
MAQSNSTVADVWDDLIKDIQNTATTIVVVPMVILVVSMIMLLITLISIIKSPEKSRSTQGKLIAWQSGTLLLGYFFSTTLCTILLIFVYDPLTGFFILLFSIHAILILMGVFYLSSHFWLNVLCFEVFFRFRSLISLVVNKDGNSDNFRFPVYCSYAILTPIFLTLVAVLCIFIVGIDFSSILMIVYGFPVLLLTVANITFFTLTLRNVLKMKQDTNMLHSNKSKTSEAKTISSVWLSLKMLLSMLGVTWIFEAALIIGFILNLPLKVIFYTAVLTSLRGVTLSSIYLIFNKNKN